MSLLADFYHRPWHWRKVQEASLAEFVNAECVAEVVPSIDPDGDVTVRDLIDDHNRAEVAELIYDAISSHEIDYDLEGYVPDTNAVQRIRAPHQIWTRKRATCLDLALLYAGACLNEGLRPIIVVLEGHALTAVVDSNFAPPLPEPSRDADALKTLIENQTIIPVECTGMTNGRNYDFDFETAKTRALANIEARPLDFFFDPGQLQQDGRVEPRPCRGVSLPKLAGTAAAGLAAIIGLGWWQLQPDAPVMDESDGANLAVFPFDYEGEGDDGLASAVATDLRLRLRQGLNEREQLRTDQRSGWEVWGPTQLQADAGDGPTLDADLGPELAKRNIDVAVYGRIEEDFTTFTDVSMWFQPSSRADLGGIVGPVIIREDTDGSNGSVQAIAGDLQPQVNHWIDVLTGLATLYDATSADDLLEARQLFDDVADDAAAETPGNSTQLTALANLLVGGTHVMLDGTLPADADDARDQNFALGSTAFREAIQLSESIDQQLEARARVGYAQLLLLHSGCLADSYDPAELAEAEAQLATARNARPERELRGIDGIDPAEIPIKADLGKAWVSWCRWRAGETDGTVAADELSAVIDNYQQRANFDEQQRVAHIASRALTLRALLLADPDFNANDGQQASADALLAQCLSPLLSQDFVRDEIRSNLLTQFPDFENQSPKETCRDLL